MYQRYECCSSQLTQDMNKNDVLLPLSTMYLDGNRKVKRGDNRRLTPSTYLRGYTHVHVVVRIFVFGNKDVYFTSFLTEPYILMLIIMVKTWINVVAQRMLCIFYQDHSPHAPGVAFIITISCEFFTPALAQSFSKESKLQQVSSSYRGCLCIQADLNNIVVQMV